MNIKSVNVLSLIVFFAFTPAFGDRAGFIVSSILIVILSFYYFNIQSSSLVSFIVIISSLIPLFTYDLYQSFNVIVNTYSHFFIFLSVILGYLLASSTSKRFLDDYERAVLPLIVISTAIYLIYIIFPDIVYFFPEYNYRDTTHRTIYFLNVLMNPDPVFRNAGFVSEPGFYQIVVNIALLARTYRIGRPDTVCLFYLFVVGTTLSTAGLAIALILVLYQFDLRYRIFLGILALLFWVPFVAIINNQFEAKIANEAVFGGRFNPSLNALQVLVERPLGIGSVEYTRIFESQDIGSFDSYTQAGLRFGVFAMLALILLLFRLARERLALAALLGLSFFTSPVWFNPIIMACLLLPSYLTPYYVTRGSYVDRRSGSKQ